MFLNAPISTVTKRLCFVLSFIFLFSCQNTQKIQNPFWNPDSNCQPPCWLEIVPGSSSEAVMLSIITDPNLIDQESLQYLDIQSPIVARIYNFTLQNRDLGTIWIIDNIVTRIDWYPNNVELSTIIQRLGEPNVLFTELVDQGWYRITIFWENNGMRVQCSASVEDDEFIFGPSGAKPYASMTVDSLTFYDPNNYRDIQDVLKNVFHYENESVNEFLNYIRDWEGYDVFYPVIR